MSPMSKEQREQFIAAGMLAWDWQDRGDEHMVAAYFDALTAAGFSISLDAVRDHTNCQTCGGAGEAAFIEFPADGSVVTVDRRPPIHPCRGGSPVVWAAPGPRKRDAMIARHATGEINCCEDDPDRWFGVCECGWETPPQSSLDAATMALMVHSGRDRASVTFGAAPR